MRRKLLSLAIALSAIIVGFYSCRKAIVEKPNAPTQKLSTFLDNGEIPDRFYELMYDAQDEYQFFLEPYYHTQDIYTQVDWSRAILDENEGTGEIAMVFDFFANPELPDVRASIQVRQDAQGIRKYSLRVSSAPTNYTSIFTADDKMIRIGSFNGNDFNPIFETPLKTGVFTSFGSICNSCHGSSDGGPGPGDWDGGVLDDVYVYDTYPPVIVIWPNTNPYTPIPGGGAYIPGKNGKDKRPCQTFAERLLNQAIKDRLKQLANNTNLNYETTFKSNGTTTTTITNGSPNGGSVSIGLYADDIFWGHSHNTQPNSNLPIFSPTDLMEFYNWSQIANDKYAIVSAVATPNGTYLLKITNGAKFSNFAANYLTPGSNYLDGLYNSMGIVNGGADAGKYLQQLLDSIDAGLRIQKVKDPTTNPSTSDCAN